MTNKLLSCGAVLAAVALVAAVRVLAQPPLTPTPTAAPGYTNVVMSGPVRAVQEGPWEVRQEGPWNVKAAQDGPWTVKIAEQPPPTFIRAQRSYLFSFANDASPGRFLVSEVRTDGWVRASTNDATRRRDVWINTRVLAVVEELP